MISCLKSHNLRHCQLRLLTKCLKINKMLYHDMLKCSAVLTDNVNVYATQD